MSLHLSSHSPSPSLPPCLFSCRIVSIEHYSTSPIKDLDVCYSAFRSSTVDKVPVIRIFGSTPAGQKTCLHVHGVFPYLFIPCNHPDPNEEYLQLLARSIDHALQLALGGSSRAVQHVYKISLVKGKPFYGYHEEVQLFLKIYLYNPALIKRLSELLVAGAVMNEVLQPHESHVPFVLQFMIDHNLYGMNHIHLSDVKFRIVGSGGEGSLRSPSPTRRRRSTSVPFSPSPTSSLSSSFLYNPSQAVWDVDTLAKDKVVCLPRMSVSELEADAVAGDILNRHELSLVSEGFPGLAALWEEERQRRKALDVDTPLTPPPSPGRSSQVNKDCERRLQEELEAVIQERFSQLRSGSSSLLGSPPPCLDSTSSQQFPRALNLIGSKDEVAGSVDGMASLVDEEAVQKTVRLSQRCSMDALERSSNRELIELLNDLCQSNEDSTFQFLTEKRPSQEYLSQISRSSQLLQSDLPLQSQRDMPLPSRSRSSQVLELRSSQTLIQPSQTMGGVLLSRIRRSESVLSGSLFSTPSPSPPPMHRGIRVGRAVAMSGVGADKMQPKDTFIRSSQPVAGITTDSSICKECQVTSSNSAHISNIEGIDVSNQDKSTPSDPTQARRTTTACYADLATQPHVVNKNRIELEDNFDKSFEMEGVDELLLAGSEYDISCAQESHTPVSDVGLWEVQQKDTESVVDFSSNLKDKDADSGAVKTVYDMEDIFSSEYPDSGGSSMADFMEPMSPWNIFPEESPPVMELPHLSSQPSVGTGFPVLTKKTKRDLLRLITSSQEGEEEEGREGDREHGGGDEEEADMEEALMLQAIWDDVDDYDGNVPDEMKIPQLDGLVGEQSSSGKTKSSTSTSGKTGIARLGVRRGVTKTSDDMQEGRVLRSALVLGDTKTLEPANPRKTQSNSGTIVIPTSSTSGCGQPDMSLEGDGERKGLTSESSSLLGKDGDGAAESQKALPVQSGLRKRGRPKKKRKVVEASGSKEGVSACQDAGSSEIIRSSILGKRKRDYVNVEEESMEKDKSWKNSSLTVEEVMAQLDSSPEEAPKLKRGHPRHSKVEVQIDPVTKSSLPVKVSSSGQADLKETISSAGELLPVKRKRGRPKLSLQEKEKRKQRTKEATPEDCSTHKRMSEGTCAISANDPRDSSITKKIIEDPHVLEEAIPDALSVSKESTLGSHSTLIERASACRFSLQLDKLLVDPSNIDADRLDSNKSCNTQSLKLAQKKRPSGKVKTRKMQLSSRSLAEENQVSGVQQLTRCVPASKAHFSADSASGNYHQADQSKTPPHSSNSLASKVASPSGSEATIPVWSGRGTLLPLVSPYKCDVVTSDSDNGQANLEHASTDFSLLITSDSDMEVEADGQMETAQEVRLQEVRTKEPDLPQHSSETAGSPMLHTSPPILKEGASTSSSGGVASLALDIVNSSTLPTSDTRAVSTISPPASSPIAPPQLVPPTLATPTATPIATLTTSVSKEVCMLTAEAAEGVPCRKSCSIWHPLVPPLSWRDLVDTSLLYRIPSVVHRKPFYSNPKDVQAAKRVGGQVLRVPSNLPKELKEFDAPYVDKSIEPFSLFGLGSIRSSLVRPDSEKSLPAKREKIVLTPAKPPPCPRKLEAAHQDTPAEDNKVASGEREGASFVVTVPADPGPSDPSMEPTSITGAEMEGAGRKEPSESTGSSSLLLSMSDHSKAQDEGQKRVDIEKRGQVPTQSHQVQKKSLSLKRAASSSKSMSEKETSQLEGPTPDNTCGFKINQSVLCNSADMHEVQHLTCMSVEVHAHTRGKLRPDPELDPVLAVFYFIHHDWPNPDGSDRNAHLGLIAIDVHNSKFTSFVGKPSPPNFSFHKTPPTSGSPQQNSTVKDRDLEGYLSRCGLPPDIQVTYVSSEHQLLEVFVHILRDADPDFLIGYEVVMASWGYLIDRAAAINVNLKNLISRMPQDPKPHPQVQVNVPTTSPATSSSFRRHKPFDLLVPGRIVLNVWRFMRHEVDLTSYTFESLCFHTLHRRLPHFSHQTLTSWYNSKAKVFRYRVLEYYLERSHCNYVLLEKFNLIARTSEFARLYGIEFENIANRGSQYKVESMMLRLAKPANFIAVSPSTRQRARMAAPECIPLVMEPESRFYEDPIILLDFQSLYPSIVIAYNYCYSTCLGRFWNLSQQGEFKFGTNTLTVPDSTVKNVRNNLHISPNGVAFVKKRVRRGILPQMLEEILNTRIMVKNSMKAHKSNKLLQRLLNSRQLALKLVANTTFGYTAASYSGRMPCIEIADSIVQKGRETLERAIRLVNSTPEWGGRVVYGDTDSLFVLVKGATKDEAFRIGKEICERVTAQNPKPVKLKLEKVYLPCILQSKKRYVGLSYESPDQSTPKFDAKGIETVRRDNCPAVQKVLQKSLEILFKSRDVSLVKVYVLRQFRKLLEGNVNIQDFIIAKEYRGRDYYSAGASVPALHLTRQSMALDRRSEPRQGERVPYVVVYGSPGLPLIQLVRRPQELLSSSNNLRLNAAYYITKQLIPPLERAFSLLGVDVREWYFEGPKRIRATVQASKLLASGAPRTAQGTIGHYFASQHCPLCSQLTMEGVCGSCQRDPQRVIVTLATREREDLQTHSDITEICANCVGCRYPSIYMQCDSLDCPVLHRRFRAQQDLDISQAWKRLLHHF